MEEYKRSQMSEKTEFLLFDILQELRIISQKIDISKQREIVEEIIPEVVEKQEAKSEKSDAEKSKAVKKKPASKPRKRKTTKKGKVS